MVTSAIIETNNGLCYTNFYNCSLVNFECREADTKNILEEQKKFYTYFEGTENVEEKKT